MTAPRLWLVSVERLDELAEAALVRARGMERHRDTAPDAASWQRRHEAAVGWRIRAREIRDLADERRATSSPGGPVSTATDTSTLQRLRAALTPGTQLEVVRNTINPSAVGDTYTVTAAPTKTRLRITMASGPSGTLTMPKSPADVQWLEDDLVSWTLRTYGGITTAYRVRPAESAQ